MEENHILENSKNQEHSDSLSLFLLLFLLLSHSLLLFPAPLGLLAWENVKQTQTHGDDVALLLSPSPFLGFSRTLLFECMWSFVSVCTHGGSYLVHFLFGGGVSFWENGDSMRCLLLLLRGVRDKLV